MGDICSEESKVSLSRNEGKYCLSCSPLRFFLENKEAYIFLKHFSFYKPVSVCGIRLNIIKNGKHLP